MGHVIGVRLLAHTKTGKLRYGTLCVDKCISWCERYPKKSYACWLHRSKRSRWVLEHRYVNFRIRTFGWEIKAEEAAHWLLAQRLQIPADLTKGQRIEDMNKISNSESKILISNYCLNCLKQAGAKQPRLSLASLEAIILNAVGDEILQAKEIATRSSHRNNSHFRSILSRMMRVGLLERSHQPAGYKKPDQVVS